MKKLIITESEKSRILNMHKSASSKHHLMGSRLFSEQITPTQAQSINAGVKNLQPQIDAEQKKHQEMLNQLVIKTQSLVTPANGLTFDTTDGKTITISKAIVLSDLDTHDLYINCTTTTETKSVGPEFKVYIISYATDPFNQGSIVVKLSSEGQDAENPDASKLVERNLDGVYGIIAKYIPTLKKDGTNSSVNLPKFTNIVNKVASKYETEGLATFQNDAIDDDVYAAADMNQKMPTRNVAQVSQSNKSVTSEPIASLNKRTGAN